MKKYTNWIWLGGAVLLSTAVLFALSTRYLPFFADDALISLRYAQRLLEGKGLTWTDGQRVEGYSNLLWTVSIAFAGWLGFDLIHAARIFGYGSFVLLFALFACTGMTLQGKSVVSGTAASLTIASSSVAAVWAVGGLEQPFVALFIGGSLLAMIPLLEQSVSFGRVWMLGVPSALLCLTRPDGSLFVGTAVVVLFFFTTLRKALVFAAPSVTAVAAQTVGRFVYYGDWFPNTAYIKVNVSKERFIQGASYLSDGVYGLAPILFLAGLGAAAAIFGHMRRSAIAAMLMMFLWAGYIVFVGGDVFPGYRHFMPIQITAAFLVFIGSDWLGTIIKNRGAAVGAVLGSVIAASLLQFKLQHEQPEFKRAVDERWEWEGEVIGTLLGRGFGRRQPLTAVTAAGCIPYFSKLPALDLLGLNDRHIARVVPKEPGGLAHDHGDGKYALDLKPDIVLMNVTGGRLMFVSGNEMAKERRFRENYRPVAFEGYYPFTVRSVPFIRTDGRVGLRREKDAILHPGYLLQGPEVLGLLGPDGNMTARLKGNSRYVSESIRLPSGRWTFRTVPDLHGEIVRLNHQCDPAILGARQAPVVDVDGSCDLFVEIETIGREILLTEFRFDRLPAAETTPDLIAAPSGYAVVANGAESKPSRCEVIREIGTLKRDASKGVFKSPVFTVPKNAVLSFRIGGGKKNVGIRGIVDGEIVRVWTNSIAGEQLKIFRTDMTLYEGKQMHLEIFDLADGPLEQILVDEVVLERREANCF